MDTVGFAPEPVCGRGTVGIVWGCLATMFFVVWTVLHPDYRPKMSRVMWGVCVIVMPEAMPALAIKQLLLARQVQRRLRSIRGWESWTMEQSFLIVKNGVKLKGSGDLLTAERLVELAEQAQQKHRVDIHIDMLPQKEQIDRRSKKSWLEKIIAGGQALWFSTSIMSRLVGGYQVTLLEVITIAYACCGLVAMMAWFRCPQDINDPFEIDLRTVAALTRKGGVRTCFREILVDRCTSGLVILSLLMVTGIHLSAWQYPFPSMAEAWIWRSCSMAMLPFGSLIVYFNGRNTLLVTCPLYIIARFALLTVACTAFRRVPPSAFDTPNWSNYWGHIGN